MDIILAIFAGAVQGLTEFLPISSTGHLIILEKLTHFPPSSIGLSFDASLHLGTLISVLAFFFKDYLKALKSKKLLLLLTIGTIPAVVAGLLFENLIEKDFRQLWVIGLALILFSFVMLAAERIGKKQKTMEKFKLADALVIGCAQALALVPGISRSGSTISAGLFRNFTREDSARFAFMLSGPIIAGAGLKKFIDVATTPSNGDQITYFWIGMVTSAIVGYLTIKYFLIYLNKHGLTPFIYYRIIAGLILLSTFFFS